MHNYVIQLQCVSGFANWTSSHVLERMKKCFLKKNFRYSLPTSNSMLTMKEGVSIHWTGLLDYWTGLTLFHFLYIRFTFFHP
jgi:hypothetical protein